MVMAAADPSPVSRETVLGWLADVPDPEIPVLTITDLGIVRDVELDGDAVTVGLAPTYSGCPATEYIEKSVVDALNEHGIADVRIERRLSPP
jgi:ring-1,2-phenylacetyl-CoA epoxidase subunit PaaD